MHLACLTSASTRARLEDRFQLLAGSSRTALPRHQTLRATVEWSWSLLEGDEQILLRRLSVFAGGWTLEAAEAMADGMPADAFADQPLTSLPACLDLLTRLVEKSLVSMSEAAGETRYTMLETIRQYAAEMLEASGETAAAHARHLNIYLGLAEQVETGADQVPGLADALAS